MRSPLAFVMGLALLLSACGGGSTGGGSGGGGGGGGTGGGGGGQVIAGPGPNVATLTVDPGPTSSAQTNIPYISVTLCEPGSTTACATIDHIEVDTGSYGLRIIASALAAKAPAHFTLPNTTHGGVPLAECTVFADGYSWGPIRQADLQISSEKAANIPIQIIGDSAYNSIPAACSGNPGVAESSVATFGANGIIGVGPFPQDCGPGCASGVQNPPTSGGWYYACASPGSCTNSNALLPEQVVNPVVSFTTDNNGVIIELPAIPAAGQATATGALVFGIGTQANNQLGGATLLTVDPNYGYLTTTFNGGSYPHSFLDSGSNFLYFVDSAKTCPVNTTLYCPGGTQTLSATNMSQSSVQSTVQFSLADADTVLGNNPMGTAFDDIGGKQTDTQSFDFGLPFFYGRNVFTGIAGQTGPAGTSPFFAY